MIEVENCSACFYTSQIISNHVMPPFIAIGVTYYDKDGDSIKRDTVYLNENSYEYGLKPKQILKVKHAPRPESAASWSWSVITKSDISIDYMPCYRFIELHVTPQHGQLPIDIKKEDGRDDYQTYMNRVKNGLIK